MDFGKGQAGRENTVFGRLFLTWRTFGSLTAPLIGKTSFSTRRPALRPEANARQRYAPSGAKVFGISSPSLRLRGEVKTTRPHPEEPRKRRLGWDRGRITALRDAGSRLLLGVR